MQGYQGERCRQNATLLSLACASMSVDFDRAGTHRRTEASLSAAKNGRASASEEYRRMRRAISVVLLEYALCSSRWTCRKQPPGRSRQSAFSVELTEDGRTFVDSSQVASDTVIGELAAEAKKKNPELRATIRADQKVPHGRVIQVLDMLKQAKLSKVAFAVAPATSAPKTAPAATL